MTKKLESRQDVLDLWVSKWAVFSKRKIRDAEIMHGSVAVDLYYHWSIEIKIKNIYEILYSPESNFFEVMFPEKSKNTDIFDDFTDLEYMKAICVTAPDPLSRLVETLNETTS